MKDPQGLIMCARYALPPNHLQYCGPLKSEEIREYLKESVSDENLSEIISQFETLYPYLTYIAHENGITNPFDSRVVEAYWIGNNLLKHLSQRSLYNHFADSLSLKERLTGKELGWLIGKIPKGALAHHTFHVLNVFTRTGHHMIKHTIETMDDCRIGWGILKSIENNYAQLFTSRLTLCDNKLTLGKSRLKKLNIPLWMNILKSDIGSIYSYHWNTLCEQIRFDQKQTLEAVTHLAIKLANLTL